MRGGGRASPWGAGTSSMSIPRPTQCWVRRHALPSCTVKMKRNPFCGREFDSPAIEGILGDCGRPDCRQPVSAALGDKAKEQPKHA